MAALPPYRLAALMGIRERKKEDAEHALAAELGALAKQQKRLDELRQELIAMEDRRQALRRTYMEKAMRGQTGANEAVRHNSYVEHLKDVEKQQKEAIADQADVVAEHEKLVQAARDVLIVATQELKALEKHREKWLEGVNKARQAKEEEEMDEMAQTIYLRHRDDSGS